LGGAAPNGNHGLLIDSSGKKLVARTNDFQVYYKMVLDSLEMQIKFSWNLISLD